MAYALIRDDTGESLTLDSVLRINGRPSSQWTTHQLASLQEASDGRIQRALTMTLTITASPGSMADGVTQGAARIEEVRDFLARWDDDAALCSLQMPGYDLIPSLGVEDRPWVRQETDAWQYDVSVRQIRVAESSTVTIAATDSTRPRPELAPGQAAEEDVGTRPPKERRRSAPAALFGFGA